MKKDCKLEHIFYIFKAWFYQMSDIRSKIFQPSKSIVLSGQKGLYNLYLTGFLKI